MTGYSMIVNIFSLAIFDLLVPECLVSFYHKQNLMSFSFLPLILQINKMPKRVGRCWDRKIVLI